MLVSVVSMATRTGASSKAVKVRGDRGRLGNLYLQYRVMTSGYMDTMGERLVIDGLLITVICTIVISVFMLLRTIVLKVIV